MPTLITVLALLLGAWNLSHAAWTVELRWQAPATAVARYQVGRRATPNAQPVLICETTPPVVACIDHEPLMGNAEYGVVAIGPDGRRTDVSNIVATRLEETLRPPSQVRQVKGPEHVVLTWQVPEIPAGAIPPEASQAYRKRRDGSDEHMVCNVPWPYNSCVDYNVPPGTYIYDVYSYKPLADADDWSPPVSLTVKVPQRPAQDAPIVPRRR